MALMLNSNQTQAQGFAQDFQRIQALIDLQKIFLADSALSELRRQTSSLDLAVQPPKVLSIVEELRTCPAFEVLAKDVKNVRTLLKEAKSDGLGWTLSSEDKVLFLKTFHRIDDKGFLSLKVEARRMECSLFDLLTIANEFDLLPKILSNSLMSLEVHPLLINKFRKLMHVKFTPIWPFTPRDLTLDMSGFDLTEEKCVCLFGASFESAPDVGVVAPKALDQFSRIVVLSAGAVIRPISEKITSMVIIVDIDLRLGVIPPSLINFTARKLSLPILRLFVNSACKVGESEDHQKRLREDALGTYKEIRNAMVNYNYEDSVLTEQQSYGTNPDLFEF